MRNKFNFLMTTTVIWASFTPTSGFNFLEINLGCGLIYYYVEASDQLSKPYQY